MGFFSRLFKKENTDDPVYPVEQVEISRLADWFLRKTRSRFKDLEKDLELSLHVIAKQSEELKVQLRRLKDAELMNKNIPEKELQIMEGNRNSYLQQNAIFLSQLDMPIETNYRNALEYVQDFKEALQTFTKATAKNVQVLRYFFENELAEINRPMKRMSDEIQSMDSKLNDEEKGVTYVDKTHERILSFLSKCKHRKELLGKLEEENIKLDNSRQMKTKFGQEVENIKSRKEYSDFERLNTQRDTILAELKQLEADLQHVFSQIDRPLRKYERVAMEDGAMISDYNSDPVTALIKDDSFRIMKILTSMKNAVENDTIELKQADKDKALQRIGNLNKEFFANFVFRYDDLKKSKKKIDDQVKNNGLLRQLDDYSYKIRHVEEQISRAEESIAGLQEKLDKLGIDSLKQELEHELRLATQLEVQIGIDNGGLAS